MEAYSGGIGPDHATTPPDLGPVPSVEQLQLQMAARCPAAAKRIGVDDAAAPFTRMATSDIASSHDRHVVASSDAGHGSAFGTNGAVVEQLYQVAQIVAARGEDFADATGMLRAMARGETCGCVKLSKLERGEYDGIGKDVQQGLHSAVKKRTPFAANGASLRPWHEVTAMRTEHQKGGLASWASAALCRNACGDAYRVDAGQALQVAPCACGAGAREAALSRKNAALERKCAALELEADWLRHRVSELEAQATQPKTTSVPGPHPMPGAGDDSSGDEGPGLGSDDAAGDASLGLELLMLAWASSF